MLEKGGEEDGVEGLLRPSELTHLLKRSSQPKPSLLPLGPQQSKQGGGLLS